MLISVGPDDVASSAVFLASDEASFITATVIPVDGGACVVDVSGAAINELAAQHLGAGGCQA